MLVRAFSPCRIGSAFCARPSRADNCYLCGLGVTTVVDMTLHPSMTEPILEASRKSGLRMVHCFVRQEEEACMAKKPKESQLSILRSLSSKDEHSASVLGDRLSLGLLVDGITPNYWKGLKEELWPIIKELDVEVVTSHYVGGPNHVGSSLVKNFHAHGLLDRSILFSHACWITEEEVELLKESGSALACTPEIELAMTHGNPVGLDCSRKGVRVGLGADCTSVVGGDMFTQMRVALAHQRGKENAELAKDGKIPLKMRTRVAEIFRMATLGGAEALHKEKELGSLEEGKKADLLILDASSPATLGAQHDPLRATVMSAGVNDIGMVLVNGEIVLDRARKQGPFTRVDWTGEEAKKIKKALAAVLQKYENAGGDATGEVAYAQVRAMLQLQTE